ncbi:homeodomain-containing transcription factor [Ordospora colligata]|uniref:Homeodomain-containing transcription factor n=1 Tax=Ordospora colligata OC4 TaxID=1354746 RepID=A0A0B2ULF7_9MICR|nr:homeodomain-containing transcription factor [Ordospora colligata OC4]KHN70124.1 homeodomain-containing transcription factor [Ordospora colligata OC4]TBU16691.1 homeodomain-containing transcription factor [Ordospora colligata]TBU19264.1 homeodomain-containing transcription factor [Ordospora colligata]
MQEGKLDVREMNCVLGLMKLMRDGEDEQQMGEVRTRKTVFQMAALKEVFKITAHPSKMTKMDLALMIKLPLKAVQIWFQNERSRKENLERSKMQAISKAKSESIDPTRLFDVIMMAVRNNREALENIQRGY